MSKHFHVVMSRGGGLHDFFSSPYATRSKAQRELRLYVDADLEDELVNWEHESDDGFIESDGDAWVEIKTCEYPCMITGLSYLP